jgi:hypothetical protein
MSYIKEIVLGDVLANVVVVKTVMKIYKKRDKILLHIIEKLDMNSQNIVVIGL